MKVGRSATHVKLWLIESECILYFASRQSPHTKDFGPLGYHSTVNPCPSGSEEDAYYYESAAKGPCDEGVAVNDFFCKECCPRHGQTTAMKVRRQPVMKAWA